jgi:hypothetical protein
MEEGLQPLLEDQESHFSPNNMHLDGFATLSRNEKKLIIFLYLPKKINLFLTIII